VIPVVPAAKYGKATGTQSRQKSSVMAHKKETALFAGLNGKRYSRLPGLCVSTIEMIYSIAKYNRSGIKKGLRTNQQAFKVLSSERELL